MLIDNSIMKAHGAKLYWAAGRLSFQDSNIAIQVTRTRRPIRSKHFSVVTQNFVAEDVSALFLVSTLFQPLMKHSYIRVFSAARPQKYTLALINPRVATAYTIQYIPQDKILDSLVVARTVTHWCNKTKSTLVQVCNPSERSITVQPKTVVGTMSPVTAIPQNVASTIANNPSESSQARIDLAVALDESFKEGFNNWGGRGYDDSVPVEVTKQPLTALGLHDPLHGWQACPEFIAFNQEVGQICPRQGLFACRFLPKRGQICYISAPSSNRSLADTVPCSTIISRHSYLICVQSIGLFFHYLPERTGQMFYF